MNSKLRLVRRTRKLKGRDVAARLGVTTQAVHDLERRGVRSVATAEKYAAALGCSPLDILEFNNKEAGK